MNTCSKVPAQVRNVLRACLTNDFKHVMRIYLGTEDIRSKVFSVIQVCQDDYVAAAVLNLNV